MRIVCLVLVLCVAVVIPARAENTPPSLSAIVAQQQAIRIEVEARSGRFERMPNVKRQLILRKQDQLFGLLQGKSSIEELDATRKTEAFNALQSIKAAIDNKDDERMICERTKPTGSNQVERVCKSLAQMRADQEVARENMTFQHATGKLDIEP